MVYVANVGDEDKAADGVGGVRVVYARGAGVCREQGRLGGGDQRAGGGEVVDVEEHAEMRAEMGLVARDTTMRSSGEGRAG
jgi:hypothetical protein